MTIYRVSNSQVSVTYWGAWDISLKDNGEYCKFMIAVIIK
jgi:hypothetical protein